MRRRMISATCESTPLPAITVLHVSRRRQTYTRARATLSRVLPDVLNLDSMWERGPAPNPRDLR